MSSSSPPHRAVSGSASSGVSLHDLVGDDMTASTSVPSPHALAPDDLEEQVRESLLPAQHEAASLQEFRRHVPRDHSGGDDGDGDHGDARSVRGQCMALLRARVMIKRRLWKQTMCEVFSPVVLLSVLVIGWALSLSQVEHHRNRVYTSREVDLDALLAQPPAVPSTVDDAVGMSWMNSSMDWTGLDAVLDEHSVLRSPEALVAYLYKYPEAAAVMRFDKSGGGGTTKVCIPGTTLCFVLNADDADAIARLLTAPGPYPVPTFDTYVGIHRLLRDLLANYSAGALADALPSYYGNLLYLGDVSFAPDTPQVRHVVEYLKARHATFASVYHKTFDTEKEAVDYAVSGSKRHSWAVISFNDLNPQTGLADVTIRLNYSSLPSTRSLGRRFKVGLGQRYNRYFLSGFLTLQSCIEDFLFSAVKNSSGKAAPSFTPSPFVEPAPVRPAMIGVPFPTHKYSGNPFYGATGPLVAVLMTLSMMYPVSRLVKSLVEAKESRRKETMFISGLFSSSFLASWFTMAFCTFLLTTISITIMLSLTLLQHTSAAILFIYFFLFGLCCVAFAFLVSVWFSRAKLAGTIAPILLFAALMPRYALFSRGDPDDAVGAKLAISLLAPSAFAFGADTLLQYEGASIGLQFDNVASTGGYTFADVLIFLFIDFVLYMVLALYLEHVLPNMYGHSRSVIFCLPKTWQRSLSSWFKRMLGRDEALPSGDAGDGAITEPIDPHLVGQELIDVVGLGKQYPGNVVAVNNLNLTIYPGVSCVLGVNGAGKSTTINMLTGLLRPTSGDAYILGHPIASFEGISAARAFMGVCPQHSVLFDHLTVREHLVLYARIRGVPEDRIPEEVRALVVDIGLAAKKHALASQLSGGMKRKLSVGCALVGGARIVFLDEPTAGVDAGSRREIQELIIRNKTLGDRSRAIILTTHFLDEADQCGDRIAVMAAGRVRTYGSSLFLKRKFGVGYTLTIVSQELARLSSIEALVKNHVPEASRLRHSAGELRIRLPFTASSAFANLFRELQADSKDGSEYSFGLSMVSLEDVFLRIGAGATSAVEMSADVRDPTKPEAVLSPEESAAQEVQPRQAHVHKTRPGLPVQIREMVRKRFLTARRDLKSRFFEVVLPVAVVAFVLLILRLNINPAGPSLNLSAGLFESDNTMLRRLNRHKAVSQEHAAEQQRQQQEPLELSTDAMEAFEQVYDRFWTNAGTQQTSKHASEVYVTPQTSPLVAELAQNPAMHVIPYPCTNSTCLSEFLLDEAQRHPKPRYGSFSLNDTLYFDVLYNKTLLTVPFSSARTVLHNTSSYHALPAFYRELTDAELRLANEQGGFTVRNHPLPLTELGETQIKTFLSLFAALFCLIPFCYLPASFVVFIVKERQSQAKHQQLVSGLEPTALWAGHFIWDIVNYLFVIGFVMLVFLAYGNAEFTGSSELTGATFSLLFCYGLAVLPLSYVYSFLFKNPNSAQVGVASLHFVSGFVLVIAAFVLDNVESTAATNHQLRKFLYRLFPPFNLGEGLLNLATLNFSELIQGGDVSPFQMDVVGRNLIFLVAESMVFFVLVLALEQWQVLICGRLQMCFSCQRDGASGGDERARLATERQKRRAQRSLKHGANSPHAYHQLASAEEENGHDDHVALPMFEEDEDVAAERARDKSQDLLAVHGLRKQYDNGTVAVNSLSLGIAAGECWGLLGANGAGKSTTLSMLTGDVYPTHGDATVAGYSIVDDMRKVRTLVGYCPQMNPLLEYLTAYEQLAMYARLQGIPEETVDGHVRQLIDDVGLSEYADRPCGGYSGGNKRKLSLAIALVGLPQLVYLDEPSAGMDVSAKRMMWKAIQSVVIDKGVTAVLTTHSIEEAETLCQRCGILSRGNLIAVGSVQHLKSKYADGYRLELRSSPEVEEDVVGLLGLPHSAKVVERAGLRVEMTVDTHDVADCFEALEHAKQEGWIEEYSCSQQTLESIFISLIRRDEALDAAEQEDDEDDGTRD